jgi:STE24 endopeptidase
MTAVLVAVLLGLFLLRAAAALLNLRAQPPEPPAAFAAEIDPARHATSLAYTRAKTLAGLLEDAALLAVFLAFWLGGGFAWLHGWSESWGLGPLATGLAVISLLLLAQWLLALPFDLHHTFVTEQRFGFNRTDGRTYALDQVKSLALGALLGLPVLAAILAIFRAVPQAWLWAWLLVSAWSLAVAFLAPSLILPMFNKFKPLEPGALSEGIAALAARCGFPLAGVFVMDGSKRSAKANAFFTGFGRHRRIALFDTLVERHGTGELLAVLAHEIGHFKKRHIWQQIAVSLASTGLMFLLLDLCLHRAPLYAVFGLAVDPQAPPLHFGLVFFLVVFKPVQQLLAVARNALSRRHEFEADAFAAQATGQPADLILALRRLSADNLSNLTPHPLLVWLDYTHPPVLERLVALEKLAAAHSSNSG